MTVQELRRVDPRGSKLHDRAKQPLERAVELSREAGYWMRVSRRKIPVLSWAADRKTGRLINQIGRLTAKATPHLRALESDIPDSLRRQELFYLAEISQGLGQILQLGERIKSDKLSTRVRRRLQEQKRELRPLVLASSKALLGVGERRRALAPA